MRHERAAQIGIDRAKEQRLLAAWGAAGRLARAVGTGARNQRRTPLYAQLAHLRLPHQ